MKTVQVYATRVNKTHIHFKCPYCYTSYKKNGEPRATAKQIEHTHGNDEMVLHVENYGTRSPHCYLEGHKRMLRDGVSNFEILTNEYTEFSED